MASGWREKKGREGLSVKVTAKIVMMLGMSYIYIYRYVL